MIGVIVGWIIILAWFGLVGLIIYPSITAAIWKRRCRERFEWPENKDEGLLLCRLKPGHAERHYARSHHHGVFSETWWKEGTHD